MNRQPLLLTPGTLWPALRERTEEARRCGAIQSIPTATETIEQGGVLFIIRVVAALAKKAEAATTHSPSAHSQAAQPPVNPFLPYDPGLFVADLSPTHVSLLNKFNVVDHHLLIVTRSFEEQELLLTEQDCLALLACLAEIDGLGFYNAGPVAGTEVVQLYVGYDNTALKTGWGRPVKDLRAFARAEDLAPGATKTVTLTVKASDLGYWDAESDRWVVEKMDHQLYVGPSSDSAHPNMLKGTFTIQ